MSSCKLKSTPVEKAVVGTYRKIENTVTGTYKKIENAAVHGYQRIEGAFVEKFLERVEDDNAPRETQK